MYVNIHILIHVHMYTYIHTYKHICIYILQASVEAFLRIFKTLTRQWLPILKQLLIDLRKLGAKVNKRIGEGGRERAKKANVQKNFFPENFSFLIFFPQTAPS